MTSLSVRRAALSMGAAALMLPLAASAQPASSGWTGRWTVSDDKPVYTARGRAYRTLDIAPCGKDFCGVSVGDRSRCGPVLFRFAGKRRDETIFQAHGQWGTERRYIQVERWAAAGSEPAGMELYLGDSYDLGGRSGSMPRFHANYKPAGAARCTTR